MAKQVKISVAEILEETRRIGAVMARTYPTMIYQGKITPATAANRLAINKKLVELLQQAENSHQPEKTILTLFNQTN